MSSEWSGPNAQQYPSNEPDGVKRLIGVVQDVAQRSRDATKNLLRTAGIFIADTGMRIESALTVNGNLTATGALNVTGDAVFSGDLAVPNGSITNDALQNPVAFLADFNDNNSLVLTTAETNLCSYTFTIPAGFTKVLVVGYGSIGIVNPTGSPSSIGGRVYIDRPTTPVFGPRRFQQALAGADAACYPYKQTVITDVSGGEVVTVRLVGLNSGASNWGATAGGASLNVQAYMGRS